MYGQNAEELVGEHISGADRFNIVATCIGKTVLQIFLFHCIIRQGSYIFGIHWYHLPIDTIVLHPEIIIGNIINIITDHRVCCITF